MDTSTIILEYFKLLLSTQVIAGIVVFIFVVMFKDDIKNLIARLGTIKFPGGEISTSQAEKGKGEPPSTQTAPQVPLENIPTIPQNLSLTPEQVEQVRQLFQAERANAYLWEYRYLNYFLVPQTQRVLDWLASLPQRTNLSLFDAIWQPIIPSAQERQAIIDALQQHHLIQLNDELIDVTPKGKEYIAWRGPLPPLPS